MGSFCFHGTATYRRAGGEVNSLIGVFMVQIRPNCDITFRDQFKRLVYQALIG